MTMPQPELIPGTYEAKAGALIANQKRQNELKVAINAKVGEEQLELNDLRAAYRDLEPEVIEWIENTSAAPLLDGVELISEWVKLKVRVGEKELKQPTGDTETTKHVAMEPMDGDPPAHVAGMVVSVFKRRPARERAPQGDEAPKRPRGRPRKLTPEQAAAIEAEQAAAANGDLARRLGETTFDAAFGDIDDVRAANFERRKAAAATMRAGGYDPESPDVQAARAQRAAATTGALAERLTDGLA